MRLVTSQQHLAEDFASTSNGEFQDTPYFRNLYEPFRALDVSLLIYFSDTYYF